MAVTAEKGEAATHPEISHADGAAGGQAEAGQLLCCGKAAPLHADPCRGGLIISTSQLPKHAVEVQTGW